MKGLRYQKRVRVLPFLWLNISKTGVSVTLGGRFVKLNIGRQGVWLSGSLVGTGLSWRRKVPLVTSENNKHSKSAE
ncbi:hypothetical protein XM75_u0079 [Vibrio vulnificus]|uniref:DUF4236 domain-containing protein n=1 Tax=Vibrio vulnificus TaxID=672 RepID=A0AAI8ZLA9_VIBVL|nr:MULTISPECIES: DUF4236 domain-containing protein [Vibrio]EHU8077670.1 DUF4236 domain-containing protein [Vibrio cholerae]EHV9953726.1 DUF4236 domain-containing protein [Vibrio cholerae]MEB5557089.1 DUF4236 domain-containing protein [Vibrio cholerae]OQK43798.1 hypothetical protein XM75_u0079 [Vibrio vulnificus]CDM12454.1 hypothetical protein [Vibrio vulnificus]